MGKRDTKVWAEERFRAKGETKVWTEERFRAREDKGMGRGKV